MNKSRIPVATDQIAAFCRGRRIRRLALFGSVLRDDFRSDSDVDVLVEFEPGCAPGWDIVSMEDELSSLFGGRKVDLVTERSLNRWIRHRVHHEAEVLYAAQG